MGRRSEANAVTELSFRLFGKFTALCDGEQIEELGSGKAQELLAYLLIYRDRPHPRESLAELLWQAPSGATAKKYLRQVLWQMQQALPIEGLIDNQPDWIRISREANYQLDVAEFEQAFSRARGVPGQQLDSRVVAGLEQAAALYRGDLLEGWYSDWSIFERERLQNTWLAMLDKLMSYCEIRQDYEAGQAYGIQVLRIDRAREQTHRRLMRMAYLAGDRTGALRQYERCAQALKEELGVRPSRQTEELHRLVQNDALDVARDTVTQNPKGTVSGRIDQLRIILTQFRDRINKDLDTLEHALTDAE